MDKKLEARGKWAQKAQMRRRIKQRKIKMIKLMNLVKSPRLWEWTRNWKQEAKSSYAALPVKSGTIRLSANGTLQIIEYLREILATKSLMTCFHEHSINIHHF